MVCYRKRINPKQEATIRAWGDIILKKRSLEPLDEVKIKIITPFLLKDNVCKIRVIDSKGFEYVNNILEVRGRKISFSFIASGELGIHTIFVDFGNKEKNDRMCNFLVDIATRIKARNPCFSTLFPRTKEAMLLNRRTYTLNKKNVVGYITSDSLRFGSIWLRDSVWQSKAYKYWEQDMKSLIDCFLRHKGQDGSLFDNVTQDGTFDKMAPETDIEYIIVIGAYWAWQGTGDDEWLTSHLEDLEKCIRFAMDSKDRWSKKYDLPKRPHTCDTWDFNIGGTTELTNFVIANCDVSGFYLACRLLSDMFDYLGNLKKKKYWGNKSRQIYQKGNVLLWDGKKYLHHHHVDDVKHGDFDEEKQLSMGNTWAIVRGLADFKKARSILREYKRRHTVTGDKFPWWSLQPGYPDSLNYYHEPYLKQGGYANGGLMPWVGGELCLGAFENGGEEYGLKLLFEYYNLLTKSNNRIYTWYWLNGEPGIRNANTTSHCGWGMAEWVRALYEGLVGIKSLSKIFTEVRCSPRWAETQEQSVCASCKFVSSNSYFVYRYNIRRNEKKIIVKFTGSGKKVRFHVLLPKSTRAINVTLNEEIISHQNRNVASSRYVDFNCPILGLGKVEINYRKNL